MSNDAFCPVCRLEPPDLQLVDDTGDYGEELVYNCSRCGKFMITRTASAAVKREDSHVRANLSSWIRMQKEFEKPMPRIRVTNGTLETILKNLPNYSPKQKHLVLLRLFCNQSKYPGQRVPFIPRFDYPLAWADNEEELIFHTRSLSDKSYINISQDEKKELDKETLATAIVVTAEGWEYIDKQLSGDLATTERPWELNTPVQNSEVV